MEKFGKQYLGGLLSSMHKERLGLSRTEAELEFLKVCSFDASAYLRVVLSLIRKHRSCPSMACSSTEWQK